MGIVALLSETIAADINRPVSENLVKSLVDLYKRMESKERFALASSALGFSQELSNRIHVLIQDNFKALETELESPPAADAHIDATSSAAPETTTSTRSESERKPKRLKVTVAFDEEDDEVLLAPKKEKPEVKKIAFKKIKKEDARRLKQGPPRDIHSDTQTDVQAVRTENIQKDTTWSKKPTLAELAQKERDEDEARPDMFDDSEFRPEDIDDVENDREWYTHEDSSYAAVSQYTDLETEKPKRRPKTHYSSARTGGAFDESTGEYIDFDHEDLSSNTYISLSPHFLIPPFLAGSEDSLLLQVRNRTSRNLGPSVSPVLDPASELAIAARTGSFVVKDRKEKKERAQQARDRSTGGKSALSSMLKPSNEGETLLEKPASKSHEEERYTFEEIQNQRKTLPAYAVREELMRMIAENQIVVVIGETGSGKTTQLAQFLSDAGYTKSINKDGSRLMVGCTQPRRVAAMSVAKRVSEEVGCKLGEDVGYSIRFEDKTSYTKTRIKYLTEGILLREMLTDPNLDSYSCIIMDEAHERSLNTDILLGLFRQLLRRRRDLKLIVTSATMNADRFSIFFGNAPQFFIPGRTFPVDVFYSKTATPDYVETAVKQVMTIHLGNLKSDGDILVFMTGQEDIEATCELINEKLSMLENPPPLDVYPIYSSLPADLQKKIFSKQNAERRKVVVATNIAETSLTVDGIKYVVDCGLVKMKLFSPKLGMDTLQIVPISFANAQQRSGRAGRTAAGIAYRLYTEKAASPEQMHVQPIPEIQRANLSSVMLMLKSLKVDSVMSFPFLDPPPQDLLSCSLYDLWAMGALDNNGHLTDFGAKLTSFPMEPTLAKLILLSCQEEFLCSSEIVTIVSMLSVPNVFYRPKERADEADAMREKFLVAELDHLTLLNVYNQWEQRARMPNMNLQKLASWSTRNFVHHKSLLRARDIRKQILLIMAKNKYPVLKARDDRDVRRCLCAAYFQQLAKLLRSHGGGRGQAEYANLRHLYMKMYLHPTSALAGGTAISPQYVVYDELVLTTKEYMQCATAVEPEWLLKYGYIFYGVSPSVQKRIEKSVDFKIWDKKELEESLKVQTETSEKAVTRLKPRSFMARRGL